MRVLVVVHGFPPAAQGGSEVYAHSHARALAALGDDVLVLTRDQDASRPDYVVREEDVDGLRVVRINNTFRVTRSFEETYANPAIDAIAGEVVDRFRPDAAHIHHLTCLSTGIVRVLAGRRVPAVLTLHDYWLICHRGQLLDVNYRVCSGPDESGACAACLGPAGSAGSVQFLGARALRAIERRLPSAPANILRSTAMDVAGLINGAPSGECERRRTVHMRAVCDDILHFIAPSRAMRDRFAAFGIPADRITVADFGFDKAAFVRGPETAARPDAERRFQGRPLRLGFLGSLMISKGPHVLLEAVKGLPLGSVTVDLFGAHTAYHGDDSYRAILAPLVDVPGVTAHGPIAHEAVPAALASFDALVVPSIWPENSPLVIREAFLAGTPVIASRIGGIPELVADGRGGLLFNAGDAADLRRVVNRLLTEPDLLDELRATIPDVRAIEDDVKTAQQLYGRKRQPVTGGPRLAAVVLNFRTPDDTFLAVKSLLASRRAIDDVIVVDNDSTENVRDRLRGMAPNLTYLLTGRNLGFSGGMNVGIREALVRGAARVLLVNSDVIVPPDCVERLERCLDVQKAGITGPVVLDRSDPGFVASLGMSYAAHTGRMRHRGAGAPFHDGAIISAPVDAVSGCLMLISREVFDAIGLLDENYFFSFEEIDFCLKARRAGFTTVLDGSAVVYHEGGRSIGADQTHRLYFAARNHLLLARRHGGPAFSVVALNLAHAVRTGGGSLPARLVAVARGVRDHIAGRSGPASPEL